MNGRIEKLRFDKCVIGTITVTIVKKIVIIFLSVNKTES